MFRAASRTLFASLGAGAVLLKTNLLLLEVPEEMKNSARYRYAELVSKFYLGESEVPTLPPLGNKDDIELWLNKVREPILHIESQARFFSFARYVLKEEDQYLVLGVNLTPTQKRVLGVYSTIYTKIGVVEASSELGNSLGLDSGVYIVKPCSKFDGDFNPKQQGTLKYIKYEQELSLNGLDKFARKNGVPKVIYIYNFDKLYMLFNKTHEGSLRCFYVLTSQLNPYSKSYEKLQRNLYRLATEYDNQIVFAVVPNEDIAGKLGFIRDKKLRRSRLPEARIQDFNILISTQPNQVGKFDKIDCRNTDQDCGELISTHYTKKTAYVEKDFSYEALKKFIDDTLSDSLPQYYERKPLPKVNAKKLNARTFKTEVLDSDKDVLVEIYGKYCPACMAFAENYDKLAGDLKKYEDLRVVKVCADHNLIPEISDKKPHTPIFWYYKKGQKDSPIKYEGSNKADELKEFVKKNASFSID
jgi:thiol-disulfide isomerase/thioredoxin